MLNSSSFIQCNCFTEHPLHCSSIFQSMNSPVSTSTLGYRTSLDGMPATHSALANEKRDNTSEPSKCQRLTFGIENILYGTNRPQDQRKVHCPFSWNKGLNFITHQPFYYSPPMHTSTRPWCRPVFTQLQRRGLEKRFQATKYVTKRERLQIGTMLGLSETQVKVWFQNRRTKWRHEAAKKEEKQNKELKNEEEMKGECKITQEK